MIESRCVGQTPENIEAAFGSAREQGAVLIFDEADAMLGSRLRQVTQSADHAVSVSRTTMLRQLDRFAGLVARLVSVRQVPAAELGTDEFALSGNP